MELNITRHFVKGIRNKIVKASKLVRCSILGEWLNTIVNMLWWSLATAKGKVQNVITYKGRVKTPAYGAGGTCSPPAMPHAEPHAKSKMATRELQMANAV